MASITVVYTDNADGTVTATSSAGAAAQTIKTFSLTHACDVAKGWIQQSMPLVKLN